MSLLDNSIKFSLDIKEQNIIFTGFHHEDQQKIYEAELIQPACPHCGSINICHNGHYRSKVHYISADSSRPVIIDLHKQRVICRDCHQNSMASTTLVNKYCFISNQAKHKVQMALTEDRAMTSIATETNVSANTVQRQLNAFDEYFRHNFNYLPLHLAFDEFRGVGHQLHFIYLDSDNHQIQQILPDHNKNTIIKYFKKFSLLTRQRVKTVSVDLNSYYPDIIRKVFPKAQIIVDRFHLVQMVNRSFNQLRIQTMKRYEKHSMTYRLLKSPWKLYLKSYDDLEKTKVFYNRHLRDRLTEEHIITDGIQASPLLTNTYWSTQGFRKAIKEHDGPSLKEIINDDQDVCEALSTNYRTFREHLQAVLNATKYHYSNGPLEGVNHKIKQIIRTSYGVRNYHNLVIRIKLQQMTIKKRKNQAK